jgi:hypothetical protein
MADLIPLAVASAFWPALLIVDVVSLRAAHPGRLMASFLAGGLLTTVAVGLIVVYALQGTSLTSGSRSWFGPAVQITVGALALFGAFVLSRRRGRPRREPGTDPAERGRIARMLDRGAPLAFVAGILLNVVPGIVPLVGLERIAELDEGVAGTVALLLGFYVIMFAFIEIPLAGYVLAPEPTKGLTLRFNAWLDRNGSLLAVWALALVGAYLVVRGMVVLST